MTKIDLKIANKISDLYYKSKGGLLVLPPEIATIISQELAKERKVLEQAKKAILEYPEYSFSEKEGIVFCDSCGGEYHDENCLRVKALAAIEEVQKEHKFEIKL